MSRLERGGIITGFLIRTVIIFAIAGLALYEAGAIIVAKVAVDGISIDAAKEAAITYDDTDGSTTKARKRCKEMAAISGAECIEFRVVGDYVEVTVRKTAPTVIAHRIGPLKDQTIAQATHRSRIP